MPSQRYLDGRPVDGPEPGTVRLEIDAEVETTTHTAGIGWRIRTSTDIGPVRALARHRVGSRVAAELDALRRGVREVRDAAGATLEIRTMDRSVPGLFAETGVPRFPRARRAAERISPALGRFARVRFVPISAIDPELRHAVGEALDAGLHRVAENEAHRAHVVERILARSRSVDLTERSGVWIANGRYRVRLDPPACDCPAWSARWARVPLPGRRAQRLPCKHLVALVVRLGTAVPAELAALARRATDAGRLTRP